MAVRRLPLWVRSPTCRGAHSDIRQGADLAGGDEFRCRPGRRPGPMGAAGQLAAWRGAPAAKFCRFGAAHAARWSFTMKTWIAVPVLACCLLTGCESTVGLYADAPVRNEVQLAGEFLRVEEVDQAPVVTKQAAPDFPAVMRKAGLDGKAFVVLVVSAAGRPEQVQVEQATHALFAEAAVAAVKKWQFKPGMKGGRPVPVLVVIELTFTLR